MSGSRWCRMVVAGAVSAALLAVAAPGDAAQVKLGNGVGTEAALGNPNCDPETGQIRILLIARVPCAKDVAAADNGGATTRGVTRDAIKVVIVVEEDPTEPATTPGGIGIAGRNQATGGTGALADSARDENEMLAQFYETYGRELDIEFYVRTGIDEAAQRADALAIAEMEPFAVLSALRTTGDVLAQRKIVTFDVPSDPEVVVDQAPYRWSWSTDYYSMTLQAAEVLGKQLWGGKAKWAGDEAMTGEKRVFGIVYPGAGDASPYPDLAEFEKTVKKYGGGTIATKIEYTGAAASTTEAVDAQNQQNAVPIVAKLKDAGVTTVVAIASSSMLKGLTQAATQQEYHPEWFCTEWFNCSFDYFARQLDQEQWAHAFGVGSLYPATSGDAVDGQTAVFQWYWGTEQGTYSSYMFSLLNNVYMGVHMAGPKLTPKTFRAGLFAKPMMGGTADGSVTGLMNAYGPQVGLPYPAFAASGVDGALWFYDADIEGVSNVFPLNGTGKAIWMDGGKRYRPGTYPKGEQPFFDDDGAVAFLDPDVDAALVPQYTCDGCPSQGGAS